jgi:MoaA/NifB/PqqE/SkfB family radical SAM enzyme
MAKQSKMAFELASPTHVQIEVTENCNNSCFYCYNHWRPHKDSRRDMSLENALKLSEIIKRDIRPFITTITGGEPFINYEVTKLFSKELGENDIIVGINTKLGVCYKI